MIIRAKDFVPHYSPELEHDGEMTKEEKQQLIATFGLKPLSRVELCDIVDDCFYCGQKLSTPYVHWQGMPHGLSLHPKCAAVLCLGLSKDACEVTKGVRPRTSRDAVEWLDLFAQKREYELEDEEFPPQAASDKKDWED